VIDSELLQALKIVTGIIVTSYNIIHYIPVGDGLTLVFHNLVNLNVLYIKSRVIYSLWKRSCCHCYGKHYSIKFVVSFYFSVHDREMEYGISASQRC